MGRFLLGTNGPDRVRGQLVVHAMAGDGLPVRDRRYTGMAAQMSGPPFCVSGIRIQRGRLAGDSE